MVITLNTSCVPEVITKEIKFYHKQMKLLILDFAQLTVSFVF